jgi:hypothetical protein
VRALLPSLATHCVQLQAELGPFADRDRAAAALGPVVA